MPTPAICELTGTVFTGRDTSLSAPEPFVSKFLTITPLSLTGTVLSTKSFTVTSDTNGLFAFGLYQGGQYLIKGEVAGYDTPRGTVVTVPLVAAATLESIIYPVTGLTVQDEGVDLATLIGKFNFIGAGVTVTQTSAGIAQINITSGGGSVTSVGLTLPAIFTVMGSPVTTTGNLSATLANQTANTVFAGPSTGSPSGPAFRPLVAADIPALPYATEAYADALVLGLLDDRGNYNASVNTFPASGGSGTAGAILKGDLWTISVAGTLGGHPVTVGDVVRALVDTPGQTDANWAIGENNFGYVALNQALPSAQIYVGNASGIGTAVSPSGDVTINNTGVTAIGAGKVTNAMLAGSIDLTVKVSGILPAANGGSGVNNTTTLNFGAGGTLGSNAFNSTAFVAQTTTVNGKALSGNITLGLASADYANQGTTTTLLHGNAAGNPSFGAVSLTADVSGILPTANGGTGIAFFTAAGPTVARIYTFPDAAATVLTTNAAVTVAQGGTGLATLTANNVMLGNGTSTPLFVAPGTSGNVLTSNGTTWTSAAAAGGGLTVGTSTITSGTTTRILYDNAGVLGEYTITGTGTVVAMQTSPALTTPKITTGIQDVNGNAIINFTAAGSAVNSITIGNEATGNNAFFSTTTDVFDFRRGTNQQKLRVYTTYTSPTNYNAVLIDGGSNFGAIQFVGAGATAVNNAIFYISNSNSGGSIQMQAAGSNTWSFAANGSFLANGSDNAFDIGASGANRPRTGYFGTSLVSPLLNITSGGNVNIGGTAVRATTPSTNALNVFDGTAPVGTLANGVTLYSTAGELRVMDAAGNPTLLSPHDKDNRWIMDTTVGFDKDRKPAKRLIVDMEKLVKFLNAHFGLDFVHEFEVAR